MTECRLSWCLCRCWFAVSCFVCVLYLCFGGTFSFSIQQNREIHTFVPSWMYQVTRFQQLYSLRQSWSNYRKFVLSAIIKHNEVIWRSYTIRLYIDEFQIFQTPLSLWKESSLPDKIYFVSQDVWMIEITLLYQLQWLNAIEIVKKCLKLEYQAIINLQQTNKAQHWLPLTVTDWYIITFYFRLNISYIVFEIQYKIPCRSV